MSALCAFTSKLLRRADIGNVGHKAEPVAAGIRLLLDELRARLPDTKLLLMATFPRDEHPDTPFRKEVADLNRIVQAYRDGEYIFFLDIGEFFTDYRQDISADIMPDFLHLSAAGYGIWRSNMDQTLTRLKSRLCDLPFFDNVWWFESELLWYVQETQGCKSRSRRVTGR